jgi:modification target Cys-rich repeat protein
MKRVAVLWVCLLAGCPAPNPNQPTQPVAGISADACGKINVNPVGRKLYSFLQASAELDRASFELENTVRDACRKMATILGTSPEGGTKDVCVRVAHELDANLKVSIKSESRLVTRYKPPECRTKLDFAAGIVAECEASASANVDVRCTGRCTGTCNGACSGTCSSGAAQTCNGNCAGTCNGRCSGGCDGYAEVNASAECKASAEVRASLHTECDEPKIEVVRQQVTVIDDSKFQKALAAIDAGLPILIRAGKKLEIAGKAVVNWVSTGASLVKASGDLGKQIGDKGLCVAGQLAGVVVAAANIQARFSVSIEVSAQVSASAGATAQ